MSLLKHNSVCYWYLVEIRSFMMAKLVTTRPSRKQLVPFLIDTISTESHNISKIRITENAFVKSRHFGPSPHPELPLPGML